MSIGTAFGLWLNRRRRQLGITRKELAEYAGCSVVLVSKIESGLRRPSDEVALRIADFFRIPADEHQAFLTFAQSELPAAEVLRRTQPNTAANRREPESQSPWRALHSGLIHLPTPPTAFIGREDVVAEVSAILRNPKARLLTLVGPPGIGKTRLALRVATAAGAVFRDGVFFVGLGAIHDPELVLSSVARTLDVRETGSQPLLTTLENYLEHKQLLLVLDNFEQVISAGEYIAQLLASAPSLKAITTSREPLRVQGERRFMVPPLTAPQTGLSFIPVADELAGYETVRLFVERAAAVNRDFALTAENAAAVVNLCIILDRLPLAIELAAAHARDLTPDEMLVRLQSHTPTHSGTDISAGRLSLLANGPGNLPARQQTLRGAIAWSYDLMDDEEKRLFRGLAVFAGGCTPQAAKEVITKARNGKSAMPGALNTLLRKSMLQSEPNSGMSVKESPSTGKQTKFRMLESIREYAREKLQESGEAYELDKAHALYFMAFAERAEPHLQGSAQQEWLDSLENEFDNIRTALSWAGRASDSREAIAIGLRMAGALSRFWYVRGYISEGREQLARALALSEAKASNESLESSILNVGHSSLDQWRARALNGAGMLAYRQGDLVAARSHYGESLAIRRESGDKQGIAASLLNLGLIASTGGDYQIARSLYLESLAIRRELGDKRGIAYALNNLGTLAYAEGDYASARSLWEESLVIRKEFGDKFDIALLVDNLGLIAYAEKDYALARSLHEQSLAIRRELGDKWGIAASLYNLGLVTYAEGDRGSALSLYTESIELWQALGDRVNLATCLETFAKAAREEGRARKAVHLWGAADALREAINSPIPLNDRPIFETQTAAARARLGEEAFSVAWHEGRAMTQKQAVTYAINRKTTGTGSQG